MSVGKAYIVSTFNNTLVTVADAGGNAVAWSSAGAAGFKGTRRSTPFAATTAAEIAARKAMDKGIKEVEVYVQGPGAGRDAALRAIRAVGMKMALIADVTPMAHNGARPKKRRRV